VFPEDGRAPLSAAMKSIARRPTSYRLNPSPPAPIAAVRVPKLTFVDGL